MLRICKLHVNLAFNVSEWKYIVSWMVKKLLEAIRSDLNVKASFFKQWNVYLVKKKSIYLNINISMFFLYPYTPLFFLRR